MRAALALLALFAVAGSARAEPRLAGVPARVVAGEGFDIAWSGLGPRVREVELELSLAGGRWVRISPELEAREGHFAWRVPSGLAGPARLRLRVGGDGFETAAAVSPEFAIEARVDRSSWLPATASVSEEWWSLGRGSGSAGSRHIGSDTVLLPAGPLVAIACERVRVGRVVPSAAALVCTGASCASCGPSPRPRPAFTRRHPLRI